MLRTCNGSDRTLVGKNGGPCSCGKTFDDVYRLVIYPHAEFEKLDSKALTVLLDSHSYYKKEEGTRQ